MGDVMEQLAISGTEPTLTAGSSARRHPSRPVDRSPAARPTAPDRAAPAAPATSRVTLSVEEAAAAIGVSRDHLERHILGDLRIIYSGRRRLVPVSELQRWVERQAVAPVAERRRGTPG